MSKPTEAQVLAALNAHELENRRLNGLDSSGFRMSTDLADWGDDSASKMYAAIQAAMDTPRVVPQKVKVLAAIEHALIYTDVSSLVTTDHVRDLMADIEEEINDALGEAGA